MAQTGYTPILIYSSSTAAAAPTAGNLTNSTLGSELAINITDGKLFYKDNANVVQVIGWKVVPTSAGGTGLTSFTANQVFYASSTSAIGQSANLSFNGTTLGVGGAANASYAISITSSTLTGVGQIGVFSTPTITSAATTGGYGYYARVFTEAASFTVADVFGLRCVNASKGAGSTITNQYGIYVDDQTQGTNNYGIRALVSSGANKWNIYASGTAANYFAGQAQFANGSVGTPSISNINDTSTGIWFPAADTIAVSTNGTEDLRIFPTGGVSIGDTTDPGAGNLRLGTGNLGIGVSPYGWTSFRSLDILTYGSFASTTANALFAANAFFNGNWIYKQTAAATYYTQNTGVHAWYTAASGTAGNTITWTEAMRISNDNFVGVGTAAPAARLHLGGAITASSWTTNGIGLRYAAATYTDSSTAASGTVASSGVHAIARPTIAATNATVTYTNAATLYIANSPANGSNVTVTNPWSIWVDDGNVRFDGNEVAGGLLATSAAAPTIASATTIAPTTRIAFVSGTTAIATITAPAPISSGGGQITLIPTGLWTTNTTGNIALASTAVVNRALIMTYDATTAKWYPSY